MRFSIGSPSSATTLIRRSEHTTRRIRTTYLNDGRLGLAGTTAGNPTPAYNISTNKLTSSEQAALAARDFVFFTVETADYGEFATRPSERRLRPVRLSFQIRENLAGLGGVWFVRTSLDSFATTVASFGTTTTWTTQFVNLAVPAASDIEALEVRIYAYNTGEKAPNRSVMIDNIVLESAVPVTSPEPVTVTVPLPFEVAPITSEFFRHSEGAMCRLPDGTILLAWSRFYFVEGRSTDDNGPANIVLSRSTDNGVTWSAPQDLGLPVGNLNNMQAAFLQTGSKTMLFYSRRNGTGGPNSADKWLVESLDGGNSWTTPRRITPGDRRYTGPNDRVIRLSNGRILMANHTNPFINGREELAPVMTWSDDDGLTWTTGQPLQAQPEFYELPMVLRMHEPAIVERADGSVLMIARTTNGRFFRSESFDSGETWTLAEPMDIEALTAPPYLKRLSDGRLVLLWNPYTDSAVDFLAKGAARHLGGTGSIGTTEKRSLLATAISYDDGETWTAPFALIDGGAEFGYCYPAALEVDGELLIAASKTPDVIHPASLVLFRVPLTQLTRTTRGTPVEWLRMKFGEVADFDALDEEDSDGDGSANWEEYRAGTDPLDAESEFRVEAMELTPTEVSLGWQGGPLNGKMTPFLIEKSTTLAPDSWEVIDTVPRRSGLWQTWTGLFDPAQERAFYRIKSP